MSSCTNRHRTWIKLIAMVVVCLFTLNSISWGLSPESRMTREEFQVKFQEGYSLLAHMAANSYIASQIPSKSIDSLKTREDDVNDQKILIVSIPGLLKNTGQFAHVGLGQKNGMPAIYVDSDYYYNHDILQHEKDEIAQYETKRIELGFDYNQMREWLKSKEGKAFAKAAHQNSHSIDHLVNAHGDAIDIDSIYAAYLEHGLDEENKDVNIAAGNGEDKKRSIEDIAKNIHATLQRAQDETIDSTQRQAAVFELVYFLENSGNDFMTQQKQVEVIRGLASLGARAGEAIPVLISMFNDDPFREQCGSLARAAAAKALGYIDKGSDNVVDLLISLAFYYKYEEKTSEDLEREAYSIAEAAKEGLVRMGEPAASLLLLRMTSQLARLNETQDRQMLITLNNEIEDIIKILGEIKAEEAVPVLIDIVSNREDRTDPGEGLYDSPDTCRLMSIRALGKIGPAAHKAVSYLIDVLDSDKYIIETPRDRVHPARLTNITGGELVELREAAATALAEIAPESDEVIYLLTNVMGEETFHYLTKPSIFLYQNSTSDVSLAAKEGLIRIGSPAIPHLVVMLESDLAGSENYNRKRMEGAIEILGYIENPIDAEKAIPFLTKMLENSPENSHWTSEVLTAIEQMGIFAIKILPSLRKILVNEKCSFRIHEKSADAIGAMGPYAKEAVPELLSALKKEDREESGVSRRAMYALVNIGEPAVEQLVKALLDSDDFNFMEKILKTLREMGEKAKVAIPQLEAAAIAKQEKWVIHRVIHKRIQELLAELGEYDSGKQQEEIAERLDRYAYRLLKDLGSYEYEVENAISGLTESNDPRSFDILVKAFRKYSRKSDNIEARSLCVEIARALGKKGNQDAVPVLKKALHHEAENVRSAVQETLKMLKRAKAVENYKRTLSGDQQDTPSSPEKGSPARLLETIRDNDELLRKALSEEGITAAEMTQIRPFSYSAVRLELEILKDLGILVPAARPYHYRFSAMMVGPDASYTKTMINAINDIRYQVSKRGEERPLHRGDIPKSEESTKALDPALSKEVLLPQIKRLVEKKKKELKRFLSRCDPACAGALERFDKIYEFATYREGEDFKLYVEKFVNPLFEYPADQINHILLHLNISFPLFRFSTDHLISRLKTIKDASAGYFSLLGTPIMVTDLTSSIYAKTYLLKALDIIFESGWLEKHDLEATRFITLINESCEGEKDFSGQTLGNDMFIIRIDPDTAEISIAGTIIHENCHLATYKNDPRFNRIEQEYRLYLQDMAEYCVGEGSNSQEDPFLDNSAELRNVAEKCGLLIEGTKDWSLSGGDMPLHGTLFELQAYAEKCEFLLQVAYDTPDSAMYNYAIGRIKHYREKAEKIIETIDTVIDMGDLQEIFDGEEEWLEEVRERWEKIKEQEKILNPVKHRLNKFLNTRRSSAPISSLERERAQKAKAVKKDLIKNKRKVVKELVKMTVINQFNIMQRPAVPENKVLWHILEEGLLSVSQQNSFRQRINSASIKSGAPERIYILKSGETIQDAIAHLKEVTPNSVFDVALSDPGHIDNVPQVDGKDLKMLAFKGAAADFAQVEAIVAALRALHLKKEEVASALLRLQSILLGTSYKAEVPVELLNDPKAFARNFIIYLPPVTSLPVDDIPKLNERMLKLLIAA